MKTWQIVVILLWVAGAIGEIACIVKFFKCDFEKSYKAEIIYGVGAVSGLGAVIGYMDFGD